MALAWASDRRIRKWAALVSAAEAACRRFPEREGPIRSLIKAQTECGQWSDARANLAAARERFPESDELAALAVHLADGGQRAQCDLLEEAAGEARRSRSWETLAKRCNAQTPATTAATIYYQALAAARLGRYGDAGVPQINADRDATCLTLNPKSPWEDLAGFNQALLDQVCTAKDLDQSSHAVATRGGRQSEVLMPTPGSALEELFRCVRNAADQLVTLRPWLMPQPDIGPLAIDAWSVSYPAEGYQVSHIHPSGWLSAVYCVKSPLGSVAQLELGSLHGGADEDLVPPWPVRRLALQAGELAIFPSWIPHAATPTRSTGQRMVIALDIAPQQSSDHVDRS